MIDFVTKSNIYKVLVVIILSWILYVLLKRIIVASIKVSSRKVFARSENHKKRETISKLISSFLKYLIIGLDVVIILGIYGIESSTFVAGVSIVGAVVGLALQDVLKDLFAGIFIIMDNLYLVGDIIQVGDFKGEVIELGLRTTKIKSYSGEIKMLSNRNITEVVNYSLEKSRSIIDVGISYDQDISKVEEVILSLNDVIKSNRDIIGEIELLGVQELSTSSVVYRFCVLTKPGTNPVVNRFLLKEVKSAFDKNKIEIPYQKVVIINE